MNFWVITCGIRAQGSDTRPECGSTYINRIIDLNKYTDFTFLLNDTSREFF